MPLETATATSSDLGSSLWTVVKSTAAKDIAAIAAQAARDAVVEHAAGPVKIEWTIDSKPFAKVDGVVNKKVIEAVLKRIKAGIKNILLVGPAGAGKTKLAAQVAEAVQARFAELSCTSGMPEWHLVGRATPNLTTGENTYATSAFVDFYENGGVFLLDEIDAADPNVLLVMNSAISNGRMSLPVRASNQYAKRHEDFILIAAANTFGMGANRQYVGRNQLDASTLSRFACAVIEVEYDEKLEAALVADRKVLDRVWDIRKKVTKLGLRRVVGTRELLAVARLVHSGETLSMAIAALMTGWTDDEVSKTGGSK
jgi:MoxR-like ATPase